MTWLRSLLFNIAFWSFTLATGLSCLPLLLAPRRWLMRPLRLYAQTAIRLLRAICGIELHIEGREHLPAGAALIAAKHQSAFDTFVWFALLPDAAYVLKRELLWVPVWGWYGWKAGQIAVDRTAGASAVRHLVKAGKDAAREGRQIVIFPEGTRVAPGRRAPIQPGVAALATATGLPVVPVATDSGLVWGRRSFHKRPGRITIAVRPPLQPGLPRAALVLALEATINLAPAGDEPGKSVDKPVESRLGALRP